MKQYPTYRTQASCIKSFTYAIDQRAVKAQPPPHSCSVLILFLSPPSRAHHYSDHPQPQESSTVALEPVLIMSDNTSSDTRSKFDPKRFSASMSRFLPVEPFRFLDLPPELRLMVYNYIDIQTKQHVIQRADSGLSNKEWPPNKSGTGSSITVFRLSLPTAIPRICRLINREAMPVLAPKIQHLSKLPLFFTVDYLSLIALCSTSGPLALPPYPSDPPTSRSSAMLALHKRCQSFLAPKPVCRFASGSKHRESIHIIITQHYRQDLAGVTTEAVSGLRKLRQGNAKVVAKVVYQQSLTSWMFPMGGITIRIEQGIKFKGLAFAEWERHLRALERFRKMAEEDQ